MGKDQTNTLDVSGDGGVVKLVKKEGSGEVPPKGARVAVHYTGTLQDGTEFDCSRKRGSPIVFSLGAREVILGWDKGVATMKKGEKAVLTCGPDYAYGKNGVGPIPPNSTLKFEVELVDWTLAGNSSLASYFPLLIILVALAAYVYREFFQQ